MAAVLSRATGSAYGVADAIARSSLKGLDAQLVEDGVLVPERVVAHGLPRGGNRVRNEARRARRREGCASE